MPRISACGCARTRSPRPTGANSFKALPRRSRPACTSFPKSSNKPPLFMHNASLAEMAAALEAKKISSVELTRLFLARIAQSNPGLNAFITLDEERTLAQAAAADARIARGEGQA